MCRTVCGQHYEGGSLGAALPAEAPGGLLYDSHTGYPAEIGGARSYAVFDSTQVRHSHFFCLLIFFCLLSPRILLLLTHLFDSTQAYPEYLVTFTSPEPLDLEDSAVETVLFELSAPSPDAAAQDGAPPALSEEQAQAWIGVYVQFASNQLTPKSARARCSSTVCLCVRAHATDSPCQFAHTLVLSILADTATPAL
jgi:hypothetical protein